MIRVKKQDFHPILQVNRQKSQLQYFLQKHNLPNVPVIPLVIISYPSTIIKATPDHKDVSQVVIHSGALPSKLETLERKYQRKTLTKLNSINCFELSVNILPSIFLMY